MIAVLVPTYGRPDRLADVAANIASSTETEHRVVFAVERDDTDSIAAAEHLDADLDLFRANLAKVNPDAVVIPLSARTGDGLAAWFSWLSSVRDRAGAPAETA